MNRDSRVVPSGKGGRHISSPTRLLVSVAATLAILAGLGWLWAASLLPASYAATDMGIRRGDAVSTSPMASAPASTAVSRSASVVIPHSFTKSLMTARSPFDDRHPPSR